MSYPAPWILFDYSLSRLVVTQVAGTFPARPNGVSISYVEVDGGVLDAPYLAEYPADNSESPYTMVVSRFEIRYAVLNCGFGMGLILGSYDNEADARVKVEQVS